MAERDATLGEVVWTHSHSDLVTKDHTNPVAAELTRQVGLHVVAMLSFHQEGSTWVDLFNGAFHIDQVVCGHCHLRWLQG